MGCGLWIGFYFYLKSTDELFILSWNWLVLRGAVHPGSAMAQMSNHQNIENKDNVNILGSKGELSNELIICEGMSQFVF